MLTPKQVELNQADVDEFEQMILDQKTRFEEHMRFSVDSALTYKCTESAVDDWLETPEIMAKLVIELQRHAKAVAEHLSEID